MNHKIMNQVNRRQRGYAILQAWKQPLFLLALLVLFTSAALAQLTTADILGTVTDATGASIPNATVTLTNLGTNQSRTAQTNAVGDYIFPLLQVGRYSVSVAATGFQTTNQEIAVEAGDRARADASLKPGAASTTVNVESTTPLLQADSSTVSSTVTAQAVADLPLNGRNFVQLVQVVPGANEGPGNGLTSGQRPDDRRQTAGFSVNGQDDTLNNYLIDGIDNNERIIGTIGVRPNLEGIQEITVETNSYAPEAGRTAGGVVEIVTKSGTNQFHGSVYEYFRNDVLDARNYYTTTSVSPGRPELRQNQFGGSIGGPIWRNRTFFFGDYEGFRLVQALNSPYHSSVPTVAQYNDIHSIGGATPQDLVAAGNTAGNAYNPADPSDKIALNYLSLFPLPNVAVANGVTNNYVSDGTRTQTSNVFDARIDHQFSPNNLFFGRYTYNKVTSFQPAQLPAVTSGPFSGVYAGGGRYNFSGPAIDFANQFGFNFTHIFSPNVVLDLKAGYTRINNQSDPLNYGRNVDTEFGFGPNMNFNAQASGLTPIGINNFEDLGDGAYVPLNDIDNTFQYLGILSWTKGNHNIKFGANLIRRQAYNLQSASALGAFSFGLSTDSCAPGTGIAPGTSTCATPGTTPQQSGNILASLLIGAFTANNRNYDLYPPYYRMWEPGGFAQDTWRVTPNLTLIYGLRYDVYTPFTEAHGHIANFSYYQALASSPATVDSALQVASVNGVSATAGIKTYYNDVAPRVGFAYTLRPGTVLRGGYGITYFPGNYTSNTDLKNAPFTSNYAPNCQSSLAYGIQISLGQSPANINGPCSAAGPVPAAYNTFVAGVPLPAPQSINSPGLSFVAEDPNDQPARVQQFNVQMEQQLGTNVFTIGYVGNLGQHLPQILNDINLPGPNATSNPRPLSTLLPNVSSIGWVTSEGISNYSSLQTSLQRRFSKGLALDANYTWARELNDITGFSEEGDQGYGNADPSHIRQIEYGIGENNISSRFALSLDYQIPYGQQLTGLRKAALAGWAVNALAGWQSGKPFTIENSSADGGFSNRAQLKNSPGNDRPDQIADPHISHRTNTEWFNTAAFAPQPLGTVGDVQRNSLTGPRFSDVDLSFFKDFFLIHGADLQFRAEAFNIFNHPAFFMPNTNVSNEQLGQGAFGTITSVDPNYNPREIQFALRLQF